ncbi:MAG: hypothetical protein SGBAC_012862 [Bacillariaceae sp.]
MAALSKVTNSSLKGPAAAARARKRRISLRKQNASMDEVIDGGSLKRSKTNAGEANELVDPLTNKPKPSITGIKKQSRYIPGVPMTKEELKAWRKEARRVRNRESAAASRRRNRDLIGVLESEVDAMKSKYSAALKYIMDLEGNDSFTPQILRQDLMEARTSTSHVPQLPCGALTMNEVEQHEMECIGSGGIASHILISRPTAASKIAKANHQHQPHAHIISPLPSSDSSSQGDSDSDFGTTSHQNNNNNKNASSDDSVMAESELGEFLMDTFEGADTFLDTFEVNGLLAASV